jgi:signal transduction histidine kinase
MTATETRSVLDRVEAVLDALPGHIAVVDREGVIVAVNQRWTDYGRLRSDPAQAEVLGVGANYLDVCRRSSADSPDARATLAGLKAVLEGSRERFELEYAGHDPLTERWFRVEMAPLASPAGGVIGAVTAHTDVTERKLAEVVVRRLRDELLTQLREARAMQSELQRSNRDLAQFAYTASHDLQEPLRMISGYLTLLSQRYGDRLEAPAEEYIAFAVDGAKRMKRLIEDLLAYAQVGNREKTLDPVSAEHALAMATAALQESVRESEALLTQDALPVVPADETLLSLLFQNLIGNALKYCGQEKPRVHVSARAIPKEWLFSVQDNGIGFEPKFAAEIFAPFRRLHSRDEYSGTGMGLAICKRIVERHGGRIWAESEPGKGATVFFTLRRV